MGTLIRHFGTQMPIWGGATIPLTPVVAVPTAFTEEPVQTFQAFTADLERMAVWLVELGITTCQRRLKTDPPLTVFAD